MKLDESKKEQKMKFEASKTWFDVYPYQSKNSPYSIELKRIKKEGLISWLTHLREKNWWDYEVEKALVDWAVENIGYKEKI